MHLLIFEHRLKRHSDGLKYFVLHWPARPFLGLVGKASPPPVCFLPRLAQSVYSHHTFFYKLYLITLNTCLCWLLSRFQSGKLFQESNLVLRVLFFFDVSGDFEGGSEVVSDSSDRSSDVFQKGDQDLLENLLDVSARAEFFFPF